MRGDVTRQTFRSGKHYRSVRQQQGRVQLDADWNEQVDLQAHLDRTVTADLVGASGAPRGRAGMAITDKAGARPSKVAPADLLVSRGHYYVDGILCENEEAVPLAAQPDLPGVDLPPDDAAYVAYLDVWFEHLTAIERPGLREVALGGPDTTTRSRTLWQVRLRKATDPPPSNPTARMLARAVAPTGAPTPCVIGPAAPYRRLENQLYRIEVFEPTGTPTGPTFLWSRENGSVVAALTALDVAGGVLTIAAPGRDDRLAFRTDNWVEVTDLARTRRGHRGFLARLGAVAGTTLPVAAWYGDPPKPTDLTDHPLVRRWDGADGPQRIPTAVPVGAEPPLVPLEGGVHVAFAAGGNYRTGDYWLVPARTANIESASPLAGLAGDVEWPRDATGKELFQPPDGVRHHYADLARLTRSGGTWTLDRDDRPIFGPLTDRLDLAMAGGDGQESLPNAALAQPLRVSVTRDLGPVPGATVRFTADRADALLVPPDPNTGGAGVLHEVEVATDADGIASCGWQLAPDTGRPDQQVTARLLDANRRPTGPILVFSASLSLAREVAFDDSGCATMAGATTVQAALERLADAPVLVATGGDGQVATADAALPAPVEVSVRGCGAPVRGATVRFAVTEGGVAADGAPPADGDPPSALSVDLAADDQGVARCRWQLGSDGPLQTLTATLLAGDRPDPRAVPVTVRAGVVPAALTVDRIELPPGTTLTDGATIAVTDLQRGPVVVLGAAPDPVLPDGPGLTVTLELPFPSSPADRAVWSDAAAGTVPLRLDGVVTVTDARGAPAVGWSPSEGAGAFLTGLFAALAPLGRGDRLRGHARLAGSVLGPAAADVTRWFWLVEKTAELVVVPHQDGRLRLPSAQRAIALSLSRDTLRAALPPGVTVSDVAFDLGVAGVAARRIFNSKTPPRPLRLVVDQRYAAAGAAVQAGLKNIDADLKLKLKPELKLELELIFVNDPAAEATTRLGQGETIDGVLTDAASTDPVEAIEGFMAAVPL